jgi:hypothetical protein
VSSTIRVDEIATMFGRGMIPVSYAAKIMGCHWSTLYRYVDRGKLRGESVNQWRRYIDVQSMIEFVGPTIAKEKGFLSISLATMLDEMALHPKTKDA